jgi:predicted double-glycine peptidase
MLGYLLPLVFILLFALGRRVPRLEFVPPISWLLAGRNEFALGGLVTAWILTTPLSRLPVRRQRIAILCFIVFFVAVQAVWPFLAPAFNRRLLLALPTQIDGNGICHQGTDYNCGPAAAVTGLRRLGIAAEEGELAVLAYTSIAIGTPPDLLQAAIQQRFGSQGITATLRHFENVSELNQAGVTLAVIKYGLFVDHYVTVLRADDQEIIVGDPARGATAYRPHDFAEQWRFTGIVLSRTNGAAPARGEMHKKDELW